MSSIVDVVDLLAASMAPVPVGIGQEFKSQHKSPPHVLLIPSGDTFGPRYMNNTAIRARDSVATRNMGLEAHLWAAAAEGATGTAPNIRAAELLVDRFITSLYSLTGPGAVQLEGGEWMDTSSSQLGRLYVLRFRIYLPVVLAEDDGVTTTFTEVLAPAGTPEGTPDAIHTTFQLTDDVTGTPAP